MYKIVNELKVPFRDGEIYSDENGIPYKCVIVSYDESKKIRDATVMSTLYAREEDYGFNGEVFKYTAEVMSLLKSIGSEEVK